MGTSSKHLICRLDSPIRFFISHSSIDIDNFPTKKHESFCTSRPATNSKPGAASPVYVSQRRSDRLTVHCFLDLALGARNYAESCAITHTLTVSFVQKTGKTAKKLSVSFGSDGAVRVIIQRSSAQAIAAVWKKVINRSIGQAPSRVGFGRFTWARMRRLSPSRARGAFDVLARVHSLRAHRAPLFWPSSGAYIPFTKRHVSCTLQDRKGAEFEYVVADEEHLDEASSTAMPIGHLAIPQRESHVRVLFRGTADSSPTSRHWRLPTARNQPGPNTSLGPSCACISTVGTNVGAAMPEILYDRVTRFSPRL